jgi:hypothetical protein
MSEAPRFTASISSAPTSRTIGCVYSSPLDCWRLCQSSSPRLDLAEDAVDRQLVAVELVDVFRELRLGREQRAHLDVRRERRAELVDHDDVEHLGDRDDERARVRVECDRQQVIAPREFLRDELQGLGVDHDLREVDGLLADRAGHDVADHAFGDEAQPHEQAADRHALRALLGERDAQLVGGDQALLDEQFTESCLAARVCGGGSLQCGIRRHVVHSVAAASFATRAVTCT